MSEDTIINMPSAAVATAGTVARRKPLALGRGVPISTSCNSRL